MTNQKKSLSITIKKDVVIVQWIVFDLEATCWRGAPPNDIRETIEIGAVKVNQFGEQVSTFSEVVRPIVNPRLSGFCRKLTGIQQEAVDRAATFDKVIQRFMEWIDIWETDYQLVSWGDFDQQLLISDCELHKFETEWLVPHIDAKTSYKHKYGLKNAMSLKNALRNEGFEFEGDMHRAYDDAFNLSKIIIRFIDEWAY